ncbi:hypothetical protein H5410_059763 [Solanum commersonii]|uniref:Uncharacterized protein n=1 Tax=Solanum commersonii TaxID=4109 RepID=A0A9J5W3B0_SOLCO|nr:hypothetical protein H5410_059763 [Solanum commersonii]
MATRVICPLDSFVNLQGVVWYEDEINRLNDWLEVVWYMGALQGLLGIGNGIDKAFEAKKEESSKLEFSQDEEILITKMFNLVGERWSLIAGRIPGRTAEEIEKYWNSRNSTSQ